jgi:hypothetical protein
MELKRILELAGYSSAKINEAVAKYNEPKANHEVKTGGEKVKEPKEGKGKTPDASKYSEPEANHAVKTGGKAAPKPAEGELKTAPASKYKDGTDTGAKPGLKSV